MKIPTLITVPVCVFVQNCTFGYHAGGWGKPPVDEMGKPLYGDVFGTNSADFQVRTTQLSHLFVLNNFNMEKPAKLKYKISTSNKMVAIKIKQMLKKHKY